MISPRLTIAGIFLLALVLPLRSSAQLSTLTVVIKNIRSEQGNVGAAIYNDKKSFMKKAWSVKSGKSQQGVMKFIFENVPPGDYAISVMHDLNENGKMDTNILGIPKDGFGFSNDALGSFGPPGFERAKFSMPGSKEVNITMKYF